MSNHEHLTLDDRIAIETYLTNRKSLKFISVELNKALSTISREIKKRRISIRSGASSSHKPFNNCRKRYSCNVSGICSPCARGNGKGLCRSCKLCTFKCPDFEAENCARLSKPPYVCNGCGNIVFCTLEKKLYKAKDADQSYRKLLSESRSGVSYSEEDIAYLDSVITPLVKKGQSPHHICVNNCDLLTVSESTIYRIIDSQLISAKNIDLPRKVRFSKRKKKVEKKVDKKCRIGRTYADYLNYLEVHPDTPVVQIDTVEGIKGGKCILTIHFVKSELMLAFLRNANDSASVISIFNTLYTGLGADTFKKIFPVILTDNGSEFSNPSAIEFDEYGSFRTRIFYCDPLASQQKGSAERNHEFIRCIIPKSTDFAYFSQSDITLMMCHINSYSRESLGDKAPVDVFEGSF